MLYGIELKRTPPPPPCEVTIVFVNGFVYVTEGGVGAEFALYCPPPPPPAALIIIPFPSIELLFPFEPTAPLLKPNIPPYPTSILYTPDGKDTSFRETTPPPPPEPPAPPPPPPPPTTKISQIVFFVNVNSCAVLLSFNSLCLKVIIFLLIIF